MVHTNIYIYSINFNKPVGNSRADNTSHAGMCNKLPSFSNQRLTILMTTGMRNLHYVTFMDNIT